LLKAVNSIIPSSLTEIDNAVQILAKAPFERIDQAGFIEMQRALQLLDRAPVEQADIDDIPAPFIYAGFVDPENVQKVWDNTTRTITLTPIGGSFSFYADNILFTKTTAQTATIPNVTGNYYIYFNEVGTLTVGTSFNTDFILRWSFAVTLFWNATTGKAVPDCMNEMHTAAVPTEVHLYLHNTINTAYDIFLGGLTPMVNATGDGSLDSHCQVACTAGAIWDDAVQNIIASRVITDNIPVLYRTGATGVWTYDESSSFMVRNTGTGRAAYNQFTGATWQLTEVLNNQFLLMHLFAIPGLTKGWMLVMGQNQYSNISAAIDAASTEITTITGIPLAEHKDIASFVLQTSNAYANTPKARIREVGVDIPYIDWRLSETGGSPGTPSGGVVERQEVYIGLPAPLPTWPAIIFDAITVDGQPVYAMRVTDGAP